MIEQRYQVGTRGPELHRHTGISHVTWQDANGRTFIGRLGDNPEDAQILATHRRTEDGPDETILYGRPEDNLDAPVERHVMVWAS